MSGTPSEDAPLLAPTIAEPNPEISQVLTQHVRLVIQSFTLMVFTSEAIFSLFVGSSEAKINVLTCITDILYSRTLLLTRAGLVFHLHISERTWRCARASVSCQCVSLHQFNTRSARYAPTSSVCSHGQLLWLFFR